jgi:hypothetical protein
MLILLPLLAAPAGGMDMVLKAAGSWVWTYTPTLVQ